jgi:hypothetical protein
MTPELDARLRAMPIATKAEAVAFLEAFKDYVWENNPYGMVLPKTHRPACVRCPDIFRKAREATLTAGRAYWQLPWAEARVKFWGLPYERWAAKRREQGLPVGGGGAQV